MHADGAVELFLDGNPINALTTLIGIKPGSVIDAVVTAKITSRDLWVTHAVLVF